ncbi:MAG: helix-turn-helix domain-containing protein [Bacilli bacterium]|nr:helix-turn-helix domain-containing protein [Bacilli bacterium]
MGRPKGTKNTMRTPEEKERIVLVALERGTTKASKAYDVDERLLRRWVVKYHANGIEGLRSGSGKHGRGGNPFAGLQNKKGKTREEELELEVLKLKVEVARLKKGTG